MLARRFTIVCLLVTIFGMSLAILVAEKDRSRVGVSGFFLACDITGGIACRPPAHR
jgi:hypothetical protein